jgi:hypothetical protein
MANAKIITAIIIPMLFISMGGYVYAHWTSSVFKKYKFHICWPDAEITSYKALTNPGSDDDEIIVYPNSTELEQMGGTSTLQISAIIPEPGWYVWIGLVIHNQGTPPVQIETPIYQFDDPNSISNWFTHTEFFFGPFTNGEFANIKDDPRVWDGIKCDELPPSYPQATPPVRLEHCEKLILWIKLQLSPDYTGSMEFTLQIAIKLAATLAPIP